MLSQPSQQSPNRERYPSWVPSLTQTYQTECDTPFCNISLAILVRYPQENSEGNITRVARNLAFAQKKKVPFLGIFCLFSCVWGKKGQGKKKTALNPGTCVSLVTVLAKKQARKSFATLSLKASRDMKSIAIGPLSGGLLS